VALGRAPVPVFKLGQEAVKLIVVQVGGGLQHPARLGRVLEERGVVFGGPEVLLYARPGRLQRRHAPVVMVRVEVAEEDHFVGLKRHLVGALAVNPARDQAGLFVHHLLEPVGMKGPDFLGQHPVAFPLQDVEGLPGQAQVDQGGLDELAPGHVGIGGLEQAIQPLVLHHLRVLAGAGLEEQGHGADALGDGVDAGVDPDVLPVGLGQLARQLGGEIVGGQEEKTGGLGEIWCFTPCDRGAAPQCRQPPANESQQAPSLVVSIF
jgi:hypothetical protein